jgi:integrase
MDGRNLPVSGRSYRACSTLRTAFLRPAALGWRAMMLNMRSAEIIVLRWGEAASQACDGRSAGTLWQETGLVVTSGTGPPLDGRNLTRGVKLHQSAVGLPETIRFYDLRREVASFLIGHGMPLTAVSELLGHALTSTTLNVNAHVLPVGESTTVHAVHRLLG